MTPRTRRRLRVAAIALLGLLVVLGGLAYVGVHRRLSTPAVFVVRQDRSIA